MSSKGSPTRAWGSSGPSAATVHPHCTVHGPTTASEETGYLNYLYQSIIGTTEHKFRTGASFLFDRFDEQFARTPYERTERVPGVFFEYTYTPTDEVTVVAGVRADQHNAYGTMVTPRLHARYSPDEDWVFRVSGGRGYRTASIFAEHATVFASSRTVAIDATRSFGYGLDQEVAWNVGGNITHYFLVDYREATVSLDVYHTFFEKQVVADLDSRPREIRFMSIADGSYANSVQLELNMQPFERLETRLAYRYLDVQQNLNGTWLQRALNAQHRALAEHRLRHGTGVNGRPADHVRSHGAVVRTEADPVDTHQSGRTARTVEVAVVRDGECADRPHAVRRTGAVCRSGEPVRFPAGRSDPGPGARRHRRTLMHHWYGDLWVAGWSMRGCAGGCNGAEMDTGRRAPSATASCVH